MYGDLIEDLREGLAVSAEHDYRITRGIKKAARTLLMTYNFREAVRRSAIPIAAGASFVPLPADAGKIKAVRLTVVEGGTTLYKRLRRRDESQLPVYGGPAFYYVEAANLHIDTPLPTDAIGYNLEVWYQSNDPDFAETWLSTLYEAPLEHLAGTQLALKMRKEEAAKLYSGLWQQDVAILGRYIPELEFNDMDLGMGDQRVVAVERYPSL